MANFVPPETTIIEPPRRPDRAGQVFAAWLENFGAGLGAGAVVLAGAWLLGLWLPIDWALARSLAGIVALFVFGIIMFLRASLDEIVQAHEWNQAMADLAAADDELTTLRADVETLTATNRRLESELFILQRRQTEQRTSPVQFVARARTDNPTHADAQQLIERSHRGLAWSRAAMMQAGWTKNQWELAQETLIAAGVIVYHGRNAVMTADYRSALQALQALVRTTDDEPTPEVAHGPAHDPAAGEA